MFILLHLLLQILYSFVLFVWAASWFVEIRCLLFFHLCLLLDHFIMDLFLLSQRLSLNFVYFLFALFSYSPQLLLTLLFNLHNLPIFLPHHLLELFPRDSLLSDTPNLTVHIFNNVPILQQFLFQLLFHRVQL